MTDWNMPDSQAALMPWLLIDPLNLFQVVMLIFGRDPSTELTGRPMGYVPIRTAIQQAIERGELPAIRTNDPLEGKPYSLAVEEKTSVRQDDVRQWLRKVGRTDAFFFLTEPDDWPSRASTTPLSDNDKPLRTRERENLLALIGVLCELAGFDLTAETKGHKEASSLKGELIRRRVDLTEQTVAAKITAARELIAPKGPTRLEFK